MSVVSFALAVVFIITERSLNKKLWNKTKRKKFSIDDKINKKNVEKFYNDKTMHSNIKPLCSRTIK